MRGDLKRERGNGTDVLPRVSSAERGGDPRLRAFVLDGAEPLRGEAEVPPNQHHHCLTAGRWQVTQRLALSSSKRDD